jgi:hypothetical protein
MSRRVAAPVLVAPVLVALLLAPALPSYADTIELPGPQSDQLNGVEMLATLGTSRDQLPGYILPGAVANDELIQVAVSSRGAVQQVRDDQRIRLAGSGDYFIREAGPARRAVATGDESPVLSFGDIIWQGFSTGSRTLGAQLELDPDIESAHLPLRMTLSFTAPGGHPTAIAPDARLPSAGAVTLTLSNTSGQHTALPTAMDAPARPVAAVLDRVVGAARSSAPSRLPTTRTNLPLEVQVTGAATKLATQMMPLQVRGTIGVDSLDQVSSGSASASVDPVRIDTMLENTTRFTVVVRSPGQLALDLTATPALDIRSLIPPRGFHSWSAWADANPPIAERRAALNLLVQTAAIGSRASAYSPYLGSQLEAVGGTAFHYVLAPVDTSVTTASPLNPRPLPIGLAIMSALVLTGAGVVIWRRS